MTPLVATSIAVVSAIIALVAAVYSRWQARAARRANEISLQSERLALYRETVNFAAVLTGKGPRIAEADVWRFKETAEVVEFYFSHQVHCRLIKTFDCALKLLMTNDEWEEAKLENGTNVQELNDQRYALAKSIQSECFSVAESMKEKLRVGEA